VFVINIKEIMKSKVLVIIFISLSNNIIAQTKSSSVLGLWQVKQSEVTSMYLDRYEFFNNKSFVFHPNSYNGLNRIVGIFGNYKILRDSIFFIPKNTLELIGGYPTRSMITTEADSWEITNAKLKKIPCKKTIQSASFRFCLEDKCIFIGNQKFFYINK
jgi:hypothetical protein